MPYSLKLKKNDISQIIILRIYKFANGNTVLGNIQHIWYCLHVKVKFSVYKISQNDELIRNTKTNSESKKAAYVNRIANFLSFELPYYFEQYHHPLE